LINDKGDITTSDAIKATMLMIITLYCLCRIMAEGHLGVLLQSKNQWKQHCCF